MRHAGRAGGTGEGPRFSELRTPNFELRIALGAPSGLPLDEEGGGLCAS